MGTAAAAVFAGCAFDWGFPADSSGGGGDDDGGTPESSVADTLFEASPLPKEAGAEDGGQGSKVCTHSGDCVTMKEYCHFADYRCGKDGSTGVCTALPSCSTKDEVCACDGKTYSNECTPNVMGIDLAKSGCPIDAGTQFSCGTHICEQDKEYCLVGSSPVTYACKPPPVSTGTCTQALSCSCASIIALGCTCTGSPGTITLSGVGCKG